MFLGLGYVLTGQLAISIGLHITWNFFQGTVFGFPVSGQDFTRVGVFSIEQGGPPLWTGGAFGPEAGLMGLLTIALGSALTVGWCAGAPDRTGYSLPWRPIPPSPPQPSQDKGAGREPRGRRRRGIGATRLPPCPQ
ncbi:MAG: hypothetical protein HC893_08460 [Chloroflexaceae bacterium]|nr:hypothetical protein [Chloroflexaceae bacterium]